MICFESDYGYSWCHSDRRRELSYIGQRIGALFASGVVRRSMMVVNRHLSISRFPHLSGIHADCTRSSSILQHPHGQFVMYNRYVRPVPSQVSRYTDRDSKGKKAIFS
jgi:hypothetical protein